MSVKNSSDTIGNQTRDLPACSAVPQPTAPLRAPLCYNAQFILKNKSSSLIFNHTVRTRKLLFRKKFEWQVMCRPSSKLCYVGGDDLNTWYTGGFYQKSFRLSSHHPTTPRHRVRASTPSVGTTISKLTWYLEVKTTQGRSILLQTLGWKYFSILWIWIGSEMLEQIYDTCLCWCTGFDVLWSVWSFGLLIFTRFRESGVYDFTAVKVWSLYESLFFVISHFSLIRCWEKLFSVHATFEQLDVRN
jgi:hypothetical protein